MGEDPKIQSNGLPADFPAELKEKAAEAIEAEKQSLDKGIDAWRKIVQSAPSLWPPRRELARVYKTANRLKHYADALSESIDRASWESETEKIGVLWELVDAYRQQNQDLKVIQGLNQILTIEPSNMVAVDELAQYHERSNRWPDLISILRKKADVVEAIDEKISLNLRIANLYLEKFSNQAEAIKAFETVVSLDPGNSEAISYLKQMYEKRRDWDKLIKLRQSEIALLPDVASRVAALVEVAQMASEKLKRAPVSIELWEAVLSQQADNVEALSQLEKLYEREKDFEKLADVLERQVTLAPATVDIPALLTKLAQIYGDRVGNQDKAVAAWTKLLEVDPENRRAQDALKKLYVGAKDWDALERFYAGQGRHDEFVRVLEREAGNEEPSQRVALMLKIAGLYRDKLEKPDRAQRAYEGALQVDEQNLQAAEALIPLYQDGKDQGKLAHVLKVQLHHTSDADLRQERMLRITEILEGPARDKPGALEISLQAFAEVPDSVWAHDYIERLGPEVGDWPQIAEVYEAGCKSLKGRTALPVLAALARIYEEELVDRETAIARNQQVLEIDPNHEGAVQALARLFVATGRFPELLAIYDKKLALARSDEEKREVRFQLASLYENEVNDPAKAIETYSAILADNATDLGALQALDRLYTVTQDWKQLARTLEAELELLEGGESGDLLYRLGQVRERYLSDGKGAVDAFSRALQVNPDHAGVRESLELYLDDADLQMVAVGALEPIYDITQELERLIQCQRIKLAHEKDAAARVALHLRIGELEGASGNSDGAYQAYADAFKEDPTSTRARTALEDLAGILDRWETLVQLYAAALDGGKLKPGLEREILTVLATTYDQRLGQSDKAVEYFRRAQEIAPEDTSALEALENLYTRTERWADLIDTLKRKVDLISDAREREHIQVRIASIAEETLEDFDEAITAWKDVLGQNPGHLLALRALDRLFGKKGLDTELADNLQSQLELAQDPEEIVTLLGRLGQLREKMGDLPAAIETYRRLLDIEPGHPDTVAALERILPDPAHELELAELLEPVYRMNSDFAKLVQAHEIQVKHAVDPRRKIERLHEIATCFEDGLDDPGNAYLAVARALSEDPMDAESQQRLERLARVLGKVEDLIERYKRLVDAVEDPYLKRVLLHKVAQLATIEVGRDDIAAEAYLQAIEVWPGDLEAADALINIYTANADHAQLVEAFKRKMDMVQAPDERKQLGAKAAHIYEEVLENPDEAIAVFKRMLAIDDTDIAVLENLDRLYVRLSRWEDLKDVYSRMSELAQSADEKKMRLYVLGQVYDRELNDPERAIEVYNSVLDIDPDDFEASQALDRLYAQTERWYDLLAILERQTQLSQSSAEVVSLRFRIGELWREKLKDLARAAESYKMVLGMDPTHDQTLQALENMMAANAEPILAAQVLQPIYETAGDWEKVVHIYEVMVAHTEDAPRKLDLLSSIADIQERRLGNFDAAFEAYGRALEIEPANADIVAHLDRLAEVTSRWANLAGIYEAQIDRLLDSGSQTEMVMRVARIHEVELGDTEKAIHFYRKVADNEPDRKEPVQALDRLYSHIQQWPQLAEVLRREIRLADSEEEIIALTFRLAQVLEVALGDLGAAVESYQEILNADPAHAETRAALERLLHGGAMQAEIAQILEPLYRLGEEWEKLTELYQLELGRLEQKEERLQLMRRLSEIFENRLFDQIAAFEWMAKLVLEDPTADEGLEQLLRLARETHQWEGYEGTLLQAAEATQDREVKRTVLLQLAATYETELANLQNAEAVLHRVLEDDAKDPEALAFLDRIYDAQGTFDELAEVLRRRIAITDDSRELVALNLRLGRVLSDVIGDTEAAIAAYNQVLENESRSAEALEALERLYLQSERWQELYSTYERMVDIAPGDMALSDCYARMATITARVFESRERAVELWQRVLDLRGPDLAALTNLADLYEAAGEWRELTDILDSQIRVSDDPNVKIPLYKRLGRIWGEQLSRERNALECWQAVLDLEPSDVEALRAIAANYRSAGAWEELSETLRRLIDVGPALDQEELKELYAQLGELEGATLMRVEPAVQAWRSVLELDPADFRALGALEALFTQEARWEECVEVLQRRAAALATPTEKVDVLMQAASVWADKIGDSAAAAEVYAAVLELNPSHETASLELEQIYRQQQNWEPLVNVLFARTEYVEGAELQQELLIGVADIYEKKLANPDQAYVVLETAFQIDFSNDHVAAELERLARNLGKWNDLIASWTGVAQNEQNTKVAADLWVKIARWYDSALQNTDAAIQTAYYAWQQDQENTGALTALADFYRKQSKWGDLAGVLARRADIESETERKVEVLLALAETYETHLGDAAQASAYYEQALATDEKCLSAMEALERLYRRMNAWDRLVEVLTKKSHTVADSEEAVQISLQVGELWEQRLGDNHRAIDAYKEVLSVDSQNATALDALDRLYQATGQTEKQLDIIEHKLEVEEDEGERVRLYKQMAQMWEEEFGKPDRAIESLQKILLVNPRTESAYVDLERLYTAERRWDDLIESYRTHIDVVNDPDSRAALYFKMGRVYEEHLKDVDRAIESYDAVLSFDGHHVEALWSLSRLYEEIEDWDRAVDVMQRIVDAVEPAQKIDLNYRLGKIYDEQMRMPEEAEIRLNEALSLGPEHVPSMLALVNIYKARGDSLKAAQFMVRAEQHITNALEKTRLLYEAGTIYLNELGDENRAVDLLARVMEMDPEHAEAAEPLAELYFQREQWEPLVPLLEMLTRKTDRRPVREMHPLFYRLARAAAALGLDDKALKAYKRAYEIDSTHLPTLMGRADLLFRREQWDEAFKLYQTVLVHHRESQRDEDIVEIFFRIGTIKLKVGERPKAINMFEKALEIQPGHAPTLQSLVELYSQANDWEAVIKQKRALFAHATDDDTRLALLQQIIAIYKDRLNNPQKAIAAYLEALDIRPDSSPLLHEVLELFSKTEQWKKAVEITLRLADLNSGKIKAKYLEAAGNFTRDMLKSPDEAIEFYNQALDEDPDNLKIFERIDKILTNKKDWKNQERAYRRMIKRLGTEVPPEKRQTQIALWHALGEIYRSRLKDLKSAMQAFEVCAGLDPDNLQRLQILAELYQVAGPETHEKAVGAYRVIISKTPDIRQVVPQVKVLRRMFTDMGQYDRAWCATAVLAFLRAADQEELRFYEQYKGKGLVKARARMTEEMWQKCVYHKDEDRFVSQIMAAISQAAMRVQAKQFKDVGIKPKDARDVATDPLLFSRVFNYVTQVMGVTQPRVFLQENAQAEMEFVELLDKQLPVPSLVVGANLLQGRTEKELAYIVGRRVALLRPDHLVRWQMVVPTVSQLRAWVVAVLTRFKPDLPVPGDIQPHLPGYHQALMYVPPQSMEALGVVIRKLIEAKHDLSTSRWAKAVDFTATRAGFLMCNDLEVTARLIQAEPGAVGMAEPAEKMRDLVEWMLSDEYFVLREQLGLQVG